MASAQLGIPSPIHAQQGACGSRQTAQHEAAQRRLPLVGMQVQLSSRQSTHLVAASPQRWRLALAQHIHAGYHAPEIQFHSTHFCSCPPLTVLSLGGRWVLTLKTAAAPAKPPSHNVAHAPILKLHPMTHYTSCCCL